MDTVMADVLPKPTPDAVAALRRRAGWTQADFAGIVHASYRTVQDWEGGQRNMPIATWELALLRAGEHPHATLSKRRSRASAYARIPGSYSR